MLHRLFSIYDSKAEAYLPPFSFPARGQAVRTFADSCNDPAHMFNKHPEDYTMFALGEFDDATATFEIFPTPEPIGKAIEFKTNLTSNDAQLSLIKE